MLATGYLPNTPSAREVRDIGGEPTTTTSLIIIFILNKHPCSQNKCRSHPSLRKRLSSTDRHNYIQPQPIKMLNCMAQHQ